MKLLLLFLFLPLLSLSTTPTDSAYYNENYLRYNNHVYKKNIHTPLLHPTSFPLSFPVITLNSGEQFLLSFDDLSQNINNYTYTFIHCTPDWQATSNLFTSDYIQGYSEDNISTYDYSFNTQQKYIHYSAIFPHQNMQITKSGNYIVKVYQDFNPDNIILTMRFMVVDQKLTVEPTVYTSSSTADRYSKHEVDFTINTIQHPVSDPFRELQVILLQNYNWNNAITNLKPRFIGNELLNYNYDGENNFDAGNEFRYFDIRSFNFLSERVLDYQLAEGLYHTLLKADEKRTYKQFRNYKDYNGMRKIEVQLGSRAEIEADYTRVHFKLNCEQPIKEGNVYIYGELTNWQLLPEAKMKYNEENHRYENIMLLKQGIYDYKYVLLNDKKNILNEGYFEGNFYQTENVYVILTYYKGTSDDYYQLLGTSFIKSTLR